ncbi:MAG: hypothetical protein HC796_02180 [Synechococcaceae cyanobacterium RL_1_2]|nr:hypothetical protein [Synechococcaceae cyanobacterium RL_1_2]
MDLLEYQAKDLFKGVSIPTLPSQLITHVGEVKNLNLNYPLMLKSQVKSGGRAQAGGIRYVDNTIDAIAQTQAILNLPIWGEYPQLIMAEAHYPTYQEVFLAVVMDYWLGKPMLLGSKMGGTEIEPLLANLQQVVVDRPFSCYLAKKLTIMMGLEPELIPKVATLLSKMYGLFAKFDLDLIEINPLGIDHEGNLMALDGKVRINEAAWHRQLDYFQPTEITVVGDLLPTKPLLLEPVWTGQEEDGLVIIGNTMGLGMVAWDLAIAKNSPQFLFCFRARNFGRELNPTVNFLRTGKFPWYDVDLFMGQ